jgi:hypothetical protein
MSKLFNGEVNEVLDEDYVYGEWLNEHGFKPVFDFAREHYFDKYEIDYCLELRSILLGKDSELLKHITIEDAEHQFNERMTTILSTAIIAYTIKNKNNAR